MARSLPIVPPAAQGPPAAPPLPTVVKLAALWQEVRQIPLWWPPRTLHILRLRRRMSLTLRDPTKVTHSYVLGQLNDCRGCTEICCVGTNATVLLGLQDVATLHDLDKTHLMTHAKPSFPEAQLRERPALRRQVQSSAWQTFPVLRQDSMRACVALSTEGKCGLYPHWPLTCARFPYALHADDDDLFFSSRCRSFWVHPRFAPRAAEAATAAVTAYNARIQDQIMLAVARPQLQALQLLQYLRLG